MRNAQTVVRRQAAEQILPVTAFCSKERFKVRTGTANKSGDSLYTADGGGSAACWLLHQRIRCRLTAFRLPQNRATEPPGSARAKDAGTRSHNVTSHWIITLTLPHRSGTGGCSRGNNNGSHEVVVMGLVGFEPTIPGTQNQDHAMLDHNPVDQPGAAGPI